MSEWQPIETAPRDGTMVDIWLSFIDHEGVVRCDGPDGRIPDACWVPKRKKWCDISNGWFGETCKPLPKKGCAKLVVSHWRPRPAPPPQRMEG